MVDTAKKFFLAAILFCNIIHTTFTLIFQIKKFLNPMTKQEHFPSVTKLISGIKGKSML